MQQLEHSPLRAPSAVVSSPPSGPEAFWGLSAKSMEAASDLQQRQGHRQRAASASASGARCAVGGLELRARIPSCPRWRRLSQ